MGTDSFLDIHQTVGYKPDDSTLVVTLTSKMANQMRKDGWDVSFDKEIGHFITIVKEE
jgi:hypothetical protein